MKRVLMIAYYFPPEGNAGAQRPLRFMKHLPAAGWQPTVVALDATFYERYDPSLLGKIPHDARILRIKNRDPWLAFQAWREKRARQKISVLGPAQLRERRDAEQAPLRTWLRKALRTIESSCYHPDPAMGWIGPATRAALGECASGRPQVLWATAGPVSTFVVAQKISNTIGAPYVLDFRDSWTITYNDFEERRPQWAKRFEQRRMFWLLKGARAIIFRSRTEAECYWRAYRGAVEASRVHIIPNGFEGAINEFKRDQGNQCEVLYTGTLSDYRYDTLLHALTLLKRTAPEAARCLRLRFVGEGTDRLAEDAAALGLLDLLTTQGPVAQAELDQLARQAHALLMLGRPAVMRGYELFAGAKLFGYLKTGMPIIGILPPDQTKAVLLQVGVSTLADVESPAAIAATLRNVIDAWMRGALASLVPNRKACERYSAERQTRDLALALEGRTALEPFVPGAAAVPASLREEISQRESFPAPRQSAAAAQQA